MRQTGKGPHPFVTSPVDDPRLVAELDSVKVRFAGRATNSWTGALLGWMLPGIFFLWRWELAMRRMGSGAHGGLMAIGKRRAKIYMERSTGVTRDDVAGTDEVRAELAAIVDFLKNPERCQRLGAHIPKGVLIVGAPGTGKTLLAKAVSGEAKVPFFSLTGPDVRARAPGSRAGDADGTVVWAAARGRPRDVAREVSGAPGCPGSAWR